MAPGMYSAKPMEHTLSPIVTGSTVIGVKYNGGVLVAADTLVSYGSQARYKDVCRIKKVGEYTLLGGGGEYSDFQYLSDNLDELDLSEFCAEDSCRMGPKEYSSYIGRVMYNRRTKMNPLYCQLVTVGKKGNEDSFLSFCDHQGTYFEEDFIATGFGALLGMPILRNEWKADMTKEEAKKLIIKCLQVCFYRDCRAFCRFRIGDCNGTTATIGEAEEMEHFWEHEAWMEKRLESGAGGATW